MQCVAIPLSLESKCCKIYIERLTIEDIIVTIRMECSRKIEIYKNVINLNLKIIYSPNKIHFCHLSGKKF